jgi:tight adherence protein B
VWPLAVALPVAAALAPRIVAGALLLVAAVVVVRTQRRRQAATADRRRAVVEVAYALAAELRAGRTPADALAAVASSAGPLRGPLREAARAAALGDDAASALRDLARLPGAHGLRGLAGAWAVTVRTGGPVADVVDRLGDALEAELAAGRTVAAALAGPQTTTALLAVLPLGGLALAAGLGAHPTRFLLHRLPGLACLAGAVVLDVAGVLWMRRLAAAVRR